MSSETRRLTRDAIYGVCTGFVLGLLLLLLVELDGAFEPTVYVGELYDKVWLPSGWYVTIGTEQGVVGLLVEDVEWGNHGFGRLTTGIGLPLLGIPSTSVREAFRDVKVGDCICYVERRGRLTGRLYHYHLPDDCRGKAEACGG